MPLTRLIKHKQPLRNTAAVVNHSIFPISYYCHLRKVVEGVHTHWHRHRIKMSNIVYPHFPQPSSSICWRRCGGRWIIYYWSQCFIETAQRQYFQFHFHTLGKGCQLRTSEISRKESWGNEYALCVSKSECDDNFHHPFNFGISVSLRCSSDGKNTCLDLGDLAARLLNYSARQCLHRYVSLHKALHTSIC